MSSNNIFKVKQKIKSHLWEHPELFKFVSFVYYSLFHNDVLEKRKHLGSLNPDKTVYVYRLVTDQSGLCEWFMAVMGAVDMCEHLGYLPVIDGRKYRDWGNGENNVWEFFFSQPGSLSLQDAYRSKNVILSGLNFYHRDKGPVVKLNTSFDFATFTDPEINRCNNEFLRSHVTYHQKIMDMVSAEEKRIPIRNSIGLYARGTDFTKLKPVGSPVQPSPELLLEKVDAFREKYGDVPVFLVTEDYDIFKFFKSKLGDRLYTFSNDFFVRDYDGKNYLSKTPGALGNDPVTGGYIYLAKLLLLSECRFFIGGKTHGSAFSYINNGNRYEDEFVYENGMYH